MSANPLPMNITFRKLVVALLVFAGLHRITAEPLLPLYDFNFNEGNYPTANLIVSGNILYGTMYLVGDTGKGVVFRMNSDGTGLTNLHQFSQLFYYEDFDVYTNSDGGEPQGGLILAGNTLFGTASVGGGAGKGTVFRLNTDGTGFATLYTFTGLAGTRATNADGANPVGLILSGDTLYGVAGFGGPAGAGTVFRLNTNGRGFVTLYGFEDPNNDGANPAGVVLSGGMLFGTARSGGGSGKGAVFRLNTNGTAFTNLHGFTEVSGSFPFTNDDGANPTAGLIAVGDTVYGTATYGGHAGKGTVFVTGASAGGFTTLHHFTQTVVPNANDDGANPLFGLTLAGSTLYGTASSGGTTGNGAVFSLGTDGTGFVNLYSFSAETFSGKYYTNRDGSGPSTGVIISGDTLYGLTRYGGLFGFGTAFALSLAPAPPAVSVVVEASGQLTFSWPSSATGYLLQQNPDLGPTHWSDFTGTVNDDGANKSVHLKLATGNVFYRLLHP